MDREISFDALVSALHDGAQIAESASRLIVVDQVDPFVRPTLLTPEVVTADALAAEALFVEAPAAVGKSTMARFLSAVRHTPLLDLAKVPVATGSLKSLVSDVAPDAVARFHSAELPIIVDALDEGRMLSGEKGFEAFLATSGEFLLTNR